MARELKARHLAQEEDETERQVWTMQILVSQTFCAVLSGLCPCLCARLFSSVFASFYVLVLVYLRAPSPTCPVYAISFHFISCHVSFSPFVSACFCSFLPVVVCPSFSRSVSLCTSFSLSTCMNTSLLHSTHAFKACY